MIARAARLALRQIRHRPGKMLFAVAGIAFPVCMILLQLGFLGAVIASAESVLSRLRFDLLLHSPAYVTFNDPGTIPQERLAQAQALPEADDALPLAIWSTIWRGQRLLPARESYTPNETTANETTAAASDTSAGYEPAAPPTGLRPLMIFGIWPGTSPFAIAEVEARAGQLVRPGAVLMDTQSHRRFGSQAVGTRAESGGQAVEIVGNFRMGTGFAADGAIVTSADDFQRLTTRRTPDGRTPVSLGLLTLTPEAREAIAADPAHADRLAEQLRTLLPGDTTVTTRAAALARERRHWVVDEAIGLIFVFGTAVAMGVGMAIIIQILSSDIADSFREYATLKAMGYPDSFLSRVVESQAIALALVAYALALLLAYFVLDPWCRDSVNLPVQLWWPRLVAALVLTVGMCWASARIAIRKVQRADPASLF